ncbi:hypothetical protein TrVE_jg11839 [Triparma verrucosa]|uniref:PX domain-containing protein n=2 Tax=Triparma verrucosa TaxID=1606542 RepID=A0A9W7B9J0_9STRA|nr:hypothetical protein TrVE_jg11839 [Triparma verrucosa]
MPKQKADASVNGSVHSSGSSGSAKSKKSKAFRPGKFIRKVSISLGLKSAQPSNISSLDPNSNDQGLPPPPTSVDIHGGLISPGDPSNARSLSVGTAGSSGSSSIRIRRSSLHTYLTVRDNPKTITPDYVVNVSLSPSSTKSHPQYSVTVTSDEDETTVLSTLYRFSDFRDLHSLISPDLPKAQISPDFFPRTYRKSQFGIKLTQEQLNKRLTLLNNWIERVVSNSTKLGPASQSALTLFLAPPKDEEHEKAKIIQKRQRRKMETRRYMAAAKVQSMFRMRDGGRILEKRRVNHKATVIQSKVRQKLAVQLLVSKKEEFSAAVRIQAIVRKIRDIERFFKLAKKMRLEGKFDNNYEDIGRHSESGYLRKLSSTQIPQKVVYTGCLKIGGVLLFLRVLTEQIQQDNSTTKTKPDSSKKKSNLGHVISKTLDVHASSVIDDTTYNCKISDAEVQVVLGMMSSVDSCVQENKVILLLRSLELVEKMVPVKKSKKRSKKKKDKEQELIKVLQIKNEKHTNEVSYDLLLQGVRCVEKKKGLVVGKSSHKKLLWIEENKDAESVLFCSEKKKRTRAKQPSKGINITSIDAINIDSAKPRRLSLVVNGKADNEIELCDEVTALRVKNTLERFRRDSQERLLEKGKSPNVTKVEVAGGGGVDFNDKNTVKASNKDKEKSSNNKYTSLMVAQPTLSNLGSNFSSGRSSKQFNSNTSSQFDDDTTLDNATVISDVTMDTLEEQHRLQIQKSRIGELNKKAGKMGKKKGEEMDFGVGVFDSLMKDKGGRGRVNS